MIDGSDGHDGVDLVTDLLKINRFIRGSVYTNLVAGATVICLRKAL